jgi:hypothetical protein
VLDIALIDFMMVSSIFKKYNQFSDPSVPGSEAARVSASVKELQYMDVFSQKLNHIAVLNQLTLEASPSCDNRMPDHAGFIFKLNHAQASVAADEFLHHTEDLRRNLHDLHDDITAITGLDFHASQCFSHLGQLRETTDAIKALLAEIQVERYRQSPISVAHIEQEMRKISDLYAMAGERFVLQWVLKHFDSPIDDLLDDYNNEGYGTEQEIDLF